MKHKIRPILALLLLVLVLGFPGAQTLAASSAITVTLTTGSTNYNLLTLLQAVDATVSDRYFEATIGADSANAGIVLIGDSSLSGTRYGVALYALDSYTVSAKDSTDAVHPSLIYLRSATAGQVVHFIGRPK